MSRPRKALPGYRKHKQKKSAIVDVYRHEREADDALPA